MPALTHLESPALLHQGSPRAINAIAEPVRPRSRSSQANPERPSLALSWVLAITLTCLTTGLIGLLTPTRLPIGDLFLASAPQGQQPGELAMLEMTAPPSAEATQSESSPDSQEQPPIDLPELPPVALDLPELTAALTTEDVFAIPAAPPIETLLKPDTPRPPQPTPSTKPRTSSAPPSAKPSANSSSTGNPSATPGSGGTGGTGTSSRGSSKGYFPAPPYPASAKSRGLQGTLQLSITFGADGRVTTTSVSRSSGYSELDSAASAWVRRNWRAPAGQSGTFRQPIQFRLR
jgi:protein TonB